MEDVSVVRPAPLEISLLVDNNVNVTDDVKRETRDVQAAAVEKTIKVKVHRQGMEPILFVLKMSTPMKKLMKAFSRESNIGLASLRFLVDGKRIQDDDTPKSLELEDEDVIDVYQYQLGGSSIKDESNCLLL